MRKVETIRRPMYVAKLRCRKCGKKKTFYFGFDKKDVVFPVKEWNGWYLKDTELCPVCYMETAYEPLRYGP